MIHSVCHHVQNLPNSVIQYFLNDPWLMIQNYVWMNNPFKVQDEPIDVNVTGEKLIDVVPDSTFQPT